MGRAFIFLFVEHLLPCSLRFIGELGLAKVSRFSNEFRGPGVYRPPDLYGSGIWIKLSGSRRCKRERKSKIEGKDRETGTDRQTGDEANIQSKCRRWVMLPWQPVLSQTQCEASDAEGSLATTTRRGVSNTNAGKPGPQPAPGYLNDDSNGL